MLISIALLVAQWFNERKKTRFNSQIASEVKIKQKFTTFAQFFEFVVKLVESSASQWRNKTFKYPYLIFIHFELFDFQ